MFSNTPLNLIASRRWAASAQQQTARLKSLSPQTGSLAQFILLTALPCAFAEGSPHSHPPAALGPLRRTAERGSPSGCPAVPQSSAGTAAGPAAAACMHTPNVKVMANKVSPSLNNQAQLTTGSNVIAVPENSTHKYTLRPSRDSNYHNTAIVDTKLCVTPCSTSKPMPAARYPRLGANMAICLQAVQLKRAIT